MKKLLFILFTLCLTAFCLTPVVIAGDSGLYYDQSRNGEGITLLRNGDTVVFYFFTYGAKTCGEPVVSPSLPGEDCIADGQRWFFAADTFNEFQQSVTGSLFITAGVEYPEGLTGENLLMSTVGEAEIVGRYMLVRGGDGWHLFVTRFGPALDEEDFLFSRVFNFTTLLLEALD